MFLFYNVDMIVTSKSQIFFLIIINWIASFIIIIIIIFIHVYMRRKWEKDLS